MSIEIEENDIVEITYGSGKTTQTFTVLSVGEYGNTSGRVYASVTYEAKTKPGTLCIKNGEPEYYQKTVKQKNFRDLEVKVIGSMDKVA
jgi:hypothetical protein